MANGWKDTDPVSYGRWQAEHEALEVRLADIERRLTDRIADLDKKLYELSRAAGEAVTRRRDRQWLLMITFLTGLALPLLVLAIVAVVSSHVH